MTGMQTVGLTFVDPARIIADVTPDPECAEAFLKPDSMKEASSSQGNWLWYCDQTFMFMDQEDEVYTSHNLMDKAMKATDAVSSKSKNIDAGWCSYRDHSEHDLSFQGILNYLILHLTEGTSH